MDDQFTSGAISFGATTLFQEALDHIGPERRKEQRHPRTINITVRPLDPQDSPLSQFAAVTRDVSRGGLSFVSFKQANSESVAISLDDDDSRMAVCRVCRCQEFRGEDGEQGYLTSVEFLYERYR